jgi:NADPH:quinone reductase-like Zn-dependent oxidoreductase
MSDEITHGRVVDITIDPVAGPSIPDNIAMLAPRGIFILYGTLDGKGAVRFAANAALEQELPGGPAIHNPHLGQPC